MPALEEMDHLLTVPLSTFVTERRRVVETLKAAGRRADAAEISRLVKPSLPVWVINQLARREGALVKRLGALTAELQGAPMDRQGLRPDPAHAGASEYARVMGAHRDALRSLRAVAEKILVASGHGSNPHTLERVVHTLRAGVANEGTRAAIESGRLLTEVGEQDFTSLMGSLQPMRAASASPSPSATTLADDLPAAARARPREDPARPGTGPRRGAGRGTEEDKPAPDQASARAAAAQERARARQEATLARERARALASAQRTIERLRPQVAAAEKRAKEEARALELASAALASSERRTAAARRAVEALTSELVAAEAAARAIAET